MTKRALSVLTPAQLRRQPLATVAERRAELEAELEEVYGVLLDKALEEAAADGANVTAVAKRAGIARATIYNELARRGEELKVPA